MPLASPELELVHELLASLVTHRGLATVAAALGVTEPHLREVLAGARPLTAGTLELLVRLYAESEVA